MTIKSSQELVENALQEIKTLSVDDALKLVKEDKCNLVDMKKEIVLFCAGGLRSALATKSLKDMGYKNVSHIEGGFSSMKNNGFKVV